MTIHEPVYVFLGRFSPFHRGHQAVLDRMITDHGSKSCLVMIGSTNTRNSRTPYTFEDRKVMIERLFPDIRIIGLPDGKPDQVFFDGTTNEQWLDSIEEIAKAMQKKFIFCGGSKEDMEILSQRFETKIMLDRCNGQNISATRVRKALEEDDAESLSLLLDRKIIPIVLRGYQEFVKNQNA